jgi:glutathione S-transferase
MYELFIGNKNYSSWSLRPWVLMQVRDIAFTEHVMPFQPGSSYDSFRQFSPTGKVPCLRDGDLVVWDSIGIVGYLAERHAGLWPDDRRARTWARCSAAEMHSGFMALRDVCGMNVGVRVRLRAWPDALMADLRRIDELWNEGLERFGGPFLAGSQFSIVDAFYCPVAFRVRTYELPLSPRATEYANRLLQLPAMRAWEAAGLAEPWRDSAHDDEVRQHGDIVADLRAPVAT